ncbi:exported hypothetical protein [Xenorhabdus cabanillasii JM26]|uniref:Uncharacterized protein n=1 Tax=Xenorhabdus cabanillasii JM26 TaxID=1427517 RepID=W1J8B3_9GAMM|nr:exported hypothetical protein [Xenorhabdus cabanillasii JM26]
MILNKIYQNLNKFGIPGRSALSRLIASAAPSVRNVISATGRPLSASDQEE